MWVQFLKKGKGERKVVESYKIVYEGADGELVEKSPGLLPRSVPWLRRKKPLPLLRRSVRNTGMQGTTATPIL